jgi:hypothetical protein
MNQLKRVLGLVWIALAIAYFCIFTFGLPKFMSGKQDDLVFGIIILFYTSLIVLGLGTFGYYALMGDYDEKINNPFFFNLQSLHLHVIAYFNFNKNF